MNQNDCKYIYHQLYGMNEPDEPIKYGEIPICRLYKLNDTQDCPDDCYYYMTSQPYNRWYLP